MKTSKTWENIYNEKELDMLEYYTLWVHQIKTPIASMYLSCKAKTVNFPENRDRFNAY